MIEMLENEETEQKERFKIADLEAANWCLKQISQLQKDISEKENLAKSEREKINQWLENETSKSNSNIEYFKGLLGEYLTDLRQNNPKAKISTPYGTVSTRKTQPKWNYEDETLKSYLKENGLSNYVRIKEEVDKAEFKKYLKIVGNIVGNNIVDEDGQIIEGITIDPAVEEITVKVVD